MWDHSYAKREGFEDGILFENSQRRRRILQPSSRMTDSHTSARPLPTAPVLIDLTPFSLNGARVLVSGADRAEQSELRIALRPAV